MGGESCESAFFPTPAADYDKDIQISEATAHIAPLHEGFGELGNLTDDKDYCVHSFICKICEKCLCVHDIRDEPPRIIFPRKVCRLPDCYPLIIIVRRRPMRGAEDLLLVNGLGMFDIVPWHGVKDVDARNTQVIFSIQAYIVDHSL